MEETIKLKKAAILLEVPNTDIENIRNVVIQTQLREKYGIDIVIGSNFLGYEVILFNRKTFKSIIVSPVNITQTYKESLEIGITAALQIIEI